MDFFLIVVGLIMGPIFVLSFGAILFSIWVALLFIWEMIK